MAGGEIPINQENFEEVLKESKKDRKVDVKREKKGKRKQEGVISDDAAFELAKQKAELDKIERNELKMEAKKAKRDYTGGKEKTKAEKNIIIDSDPKIVANDTKTPVDLDSHKESEETKEAIQDNATKDIPETISSDEAGIKILENKKASLGENLETLRTAFEASKKRDSNFSKGLDRDASLDDPEETGRRAKIGIKITDIKEKISKINAEIKELNSKGGTGENTGNPKDYSNWWKERQGDRKKLFEQKEAEKNTQTINPNSLILKNMPEKNREISSEDYEKELKKNSIDVYSKVNKESELKEEQKKTADTYAFAESYKRQFGEEEESKEDVKKTEIVDTTIADSEKVDSEGQLKAKIDRLKNLPEEAKEVMKEVAADQEIERIQKDASSEHRNDRLKAGIEMRDRENARLKKEVERASELAEILAEMQAELDRQTEEAEAKNSMLKKAINYFKKPKVFGAIIFGLAGAGVYAASGGTAVPVYLAVKTALAKVGISIFAPAAAGHGLSTWGTAAAGGRFLGYVGEKLGLSKHEKSDKEKKEENIEKLRNIAGGEEKSETGAEPKIENLLDTKGNFDIGVVVKLVQKKDRGLINSYEKDPALLDNMVKAFNKKSSIFQFSDKQKNINETYLWLVKEQKRVKIAQEIAEQKAEEIADKGEINKMTVQEIAEKHGVDVINEAPVEKKAEKPDKETKDEVKDKTEKKTEQAPLSPENTISPEDKKKMIEAAHSKNKELAKVIADNKEKINTNIFENLSDILENKIREGKYEIVAPMVDLVKDMVEKNKKVKIAFLDKSNVPQGRDNDAKDKLIDEIKKHVMTMKTEGRLGQNEQEKEKKQAAIESFLNSREFRDKL